MTARWKNRPAGSNWGEFGPDDQRGRMNLVTQQKVREGVSEVKEGLTFNLSLPLDYPGGSSVHPDRSPPRLFSVTGRGGVEGGQVYCHSLSSAFPGASDVCCDDIALIHLQYSTQWDGLAHMGSHFDADGDGVPEAVFYNGYRAGEDIVPAATAKMSSEAALRYEGPRARALGIENLAEHCAQGRGVLIDLCQHFGRERRAVGYDDLMRILAADGVVVERGDMVCIHTGFAEALMEMGKEPDVGKLFKSCCGLDGRDEELLQWITDSGLACLVADNLAVELLRRPVFSSHSSAYLPLHEHCLFKNGIHLGELWYLTGLARWLRAHGRNRFLLTAPPLRLPGAVACPPMPVATV